MYAPKIKPYIRNSKMQWSSIEDKENLIQSNIPTIIIIIIIETTFNEDIYFRFTTLLFTPKFCVKRCLRHCVKENCSHTYHKYNTFAYIYNTHSNKLEQLKSNQQTDNLWTYFFSQTKRRSCEESIVVLPLLNFCFDFFLLPVKFWSPFPFFVEKNKCLGFCHIDQLRFSS